MTKIENEFKLLYKPGALFRIENLYWGKDWSSEIFVCIGPYTDNYMCISFMSISTFRKATIWPAQFTNPESGKGKIVQL